MRKIPTIFVRDPDTNLRFVSREPHPDAAWVFAGEGTPTRKYDGTCVMYDGASPDAVGDLREVAPSGWWARREVKPGKDRPPNWIPVDTDETTGKAMGWEPIEQSGFHRHLLDALNHDTGPRGGWQPGTFELCGPKINGNPERFPIHVLVRHDDAETIPLLDLSYDALRFAFRSLGQIEGIVWHHPDGRMAKLKVRDFYYGEDPE